MNVLLLGSSGQLGRTLIDSAPEHVRLEHFDRQSVDVTDLNSVNATVNRVRPQFVVNAAAYTNVDGAESESKTAYRVNSDAVASIATAASNVGASVIHVSTDFVFDGKSRIPYEPADAAVPSSVYGESKLEGEQRLREILPDSSAVIRTSWLYSRYGHNFVKTMLGLMQSRESLNVVADQVGSPTWTASLSDVVWAAVGDRFSAGIYHWTDFGETSWYDFAREIQGIAYELGLFDKMIPVNPIESSEYPTAAMRPAYSVLDCSTTREAFGVSQVEWRRNLQAMLTGMIT